MTESAIRTGIVGYGLSGRVFHSPFLAVNDSFSLDVISTSDPARAAQAAENHPGAEVVATAQELFDRRLDLVVLATPGVGHFDQALAAIESGAAAVIDKPFAASTAEARQLIALAEVAGTLLTVFQNRRYDGDFRTVQKLIADGTLGTVHRFESTFERWSPGLRDRWQDTSTPREGAGITFDLGSHLVDQALQLFGPADLVHAEMAIVRDGGVSDDESFIALQHRSGVRSHLMLSRCAGQNAPRFRVLGSESAYTVYGLDGQEAALMAGGSPLDEGFGDEPEERWGLLGIAGNPDVPLQPVRTERGDYAAFYAGMAASILHGEPMPVEPLDSLETLRIIEKAHQLNGS